MVLGSLAFIDNLSLQRALSRLPHTDAASVVEPLWSSWTFRFGSPTSECPTQRSTLAGCVWKVGIDFDFAVRQWCGTGVGW
jgi:hypothetical protein